MKGAVLAEGDVSMEGQVYLEPGLHILGEAQIEDEDEMEGEAEVAVEGEVHADHGNPLEVQVHVEGEVAAQGGVAQGQQLSVAEPPPESLYTKKNGLFIISMSYSIFSLGTCFSLPAPFFPHEAESKGASPTVYGFVFGVFQLVSLLSGPFWGRLLYYFVPKTILVTAMFVVGLCSICFGVLEFCPRGYPYIILAFTVRSVESLGVSAYITTCYGTLPYMFPKHVPAVLSFIQTTFAMGTICGPTLGGLLYQLHGFYLPFVVMGGCLIFGCFVTGFLFKNERVPPIERTGSILGMLKSSGVILDLLVFTLGSLSIGFNDATLEPHLREYNIYPILLGFFFVIGGALYTASSPIYGYLMHKGVHPHVCSIWGCSLCLIAFIIIGPITIVPLEKSIVIIITSLVLQGFGLGATNLSSLVHGLEDVKSRGYPDNVSTNAMYNGLMSAFYALGSFIGPTLGGVLLEHVGYNHATLLVVSTESFLILAFIVVHGKNLVTRLRGQPPSVGTASEPPSVETAGQQIVEVEINAETVPLIQSGGNA